MLDANLPIFYQIEWENEKNRKETQKSTGAQTPEIIQNIATIALTNSLSN